MDTKKTLVNFHIGRGGRFNNAGFLTFCGVGNQVKNQIENENFIKYEFEDELVEKYGEEIYIVVENLDGDTDGEYYDTVCKQYGNFGKLVLHDCGCEEIGELADDDNEYCYEEDGLYDTTYGVLISDFEELTESEKDAVRRNKIAYQLEYTVEIIEDEEEEE